MSGATPAATWRRRLSELGRGAGKPHPPLFAPLLYSVAAQIEALAPAALITDPTKLTKGLGELRRALGTTAITTAAPAAMEAEALGATVDRSAWPARIRAAAPADVTAVADFDGLWSRSPALDAALETTRRLHAASADDVLIAMLTGPRRLCTELFGAGGDVAAADALEFAGRALAALADQFVRAGAAAIALLDDRCADGAFEYWDDALGTIGNVARFHRVPALLVVAADGTAGDWPAGLVPCPDAAGVADLAPRACGLALAPDPGAWTGLRVADHVRIVLTAGEVAPDTPVATLRDAVEQAQGSTT
ncbi:MAG: hypothetical protein IT495_15980 [Gammaproteobacteria bacterium]|nr:hypothetical protein [Gammaproteobacteria bacterium]